MSAEALLGRERIRKVDGIPQMKTWETLQEQCDLLEHIGFAVASRECFVGYHARAGRWLYEKVLRPVNRSMALSPRLGSRYVVVARKAP